MKIYLCSRYSRRDEMRKYRDKLTKLGHTVVSTWLETNWPVEDHRSAAAPPEYRETWAEKDLADVRSCDTIICFTEHERTPTRGGRHVEFGVALALHKVLLLVGPKENLFYYHKNVTQFDSFEELISSKFLN